MPNTDITPSVGAVAASGIAASAVFGVVRTPIAAAMAASGQLCDTAPWHLIGFTQVFQSSGNQNLTIPSGRRAGDLIVVAVAGITGALPSMVTSGYTSRVSSTGSASIAVWTKVSDGTESSVTLNFSGSNGACGVLVYRNLETFPVDVTGSVTTVSSVTSHSPATVITTKANDAVLSVWSTSTGVRQLSSVDSALMFRLSQQGADANAGGKLVVGDECRSAAGSTPSHTATWTAATAIADVTIAFLLASLPGFAKLSISGAAPVVEVGVTPPLVGSLTLTGLSSATVTTTNAPAGALTLTGNVPRVDRGLTVPSGAIALAGQQPITSGNIQLNTVAMTLTGASPTLDLAIKPAGTSASITGTAPRFDAAISTQLGQLSLQSAAQIVSFGSLVQTQAGGVTLIPGSAVLSDGQALPTATGSLAVAGIAPALFSGTALPTQKGSIAVSGNAALVLRADSQTPQTRALQAASEAPSLVLGFNRVPASGSVSISNVAGSLMLGVNCQPSVGSAAIAGNAPLTLLSLTLRPGSDNLGIVGNVPAEGEAISTKTQSIALTGAAPVGTVDHVRTPASGALAITPQSGRLEYGKFPSAAALGLVAQQPIVLKSTLVTPENDILRLQGFPPQVISISPVITPDTGLVTVTPQYANFGYVPQSVRVVLSNYPAGRSLR